MPITEPNAGRADLRLADQRCRSQTISDLVLVRVALSYRVVSQPRITPEGKAQADSKRSRLWRISISRGRNRLRGPSGVKRGYEPLLIRLWD